MSVVPGSVVLLSSSDVDRLLDLPACITAVEAAFRSRGSGVDQPGGVLGVHVEHGGYHAKAASLGCGSRYFAAKLNANFPANPRAGLPTIQGLVLLSDTATGTPLAVMESGTLTRLRTAATSAVAARYLANPGAATLAVIGCGAQAQPHIEAFSAVRPLERVTLFDERTEMATALGEVIAGKRPGRLDAEEIVIFDSTGIPIEDVAAAGIVYERALDTATGGRFAFRH